MNNKESIWSMFYRWIFKVPKIDNESSEIIYSQKMIIRKLRYENKLLSKSFKKYECINPLIYFMSFDDPSAKKAIFDKYARTENLP